jgi:hypothetical protein
MPPLQSPLGVARCTRTKLATSSAQRTAFAARRSLSNTARRQGGGGSHESQFDPPGGWLWGVPPGQKAPKEGWETAWYWGFFGTIGLAVVGYIYKPDTR